MTVQAPLAPHEQLPGMVQHASLSGPPSLILLLLGLSAWSFEASFSLTGLTFEAVTSLRTDLHLEVFRAADSVPVTRKWCGSHVVGLLTTLNFRDGPDRNKIQTFQAEVLGSQI